MKSRIDKVLAVAAGHGHDTLVLGAWGCGAFGGGGVLASAGAASDDLADGDPLERAARFPIVWPR